MEIIPAVDIKGGKCVRLYQGDYARETVFFDDPVAVALRWESLGARRIHLVDLDGAAAGEVRNLAVIEAIARQVRVPVQLGGGIRDGATISKLLDIGVKRVILGTVAVEQPELVRGLCQKFGEAVIVGIDARDGMVATRGWLKGTQMKALDLGKEMVELGVKRIIYTDIRRDGTLTEPNYAEIAEMVNGVQANIIAAGGVSALEHLTKLEKLGVEGAIVGKALYTGNIDLEKALKLSQKSNVKTQNDR
ncbi:MAG: 1-(5-phosphoribosyl)-5-[(5-phosphoribosylamino)methylideneamino]imidazole-4-carboxamide isomerase [Chloroflexi bacterium]|nr:1-(5-phosphoribosyl)-5-[(5-phosphoribosylamino)methylideneamino]imidazole-4-carboxamide isomerase [Chloroflexota bacterium]